MSETVDQLIKVAGAASSVLVWEVFEIYSGQPTSEGPPRTRWCAHGGAPDSGLLARVTPSELAELRKAGARFIPEKLHPWFPADWPPDARARLLGS